MAEDDYADEEIREMTRKEFRKNLPSGWMEVTRYETLVLVIDALLESPSSREFTPSELAEQAGASPKSVKNHIDSLVRLGIVDELGDKRENVRYSLNDRSPITQEIFKLSRIVDQVKNDEKPKSLPDRSENAGRANKFKIDEEDEKLSDGSTKSLKSSDKSRVNA